MMALPQRFRHLLPHLLRHCIAQHIFDLPGELFEHGRKHFIHGFGDTRREMLIEHFLYPPIQQVQFLIARRERLIFGHWQNLGLDLNHLGQQRDDVIIFHHIRQDGEVLNNRASRKCIMVFFQQRIHLGEDVVVNQSRIMLVHDAALPDWLMSWERIS